MNIIQLGTNNGDDHVNKFCKENINNLNKIILIEPLNFLNKHIIKNYNELSYKSNIFIHNKIIVPKIEKKFIPIYYSLHDADKEYDGYFSRESENDIIRSYCLSSINKNHIINHYSDEHKNTINNSINSIDVETNTINNIIDIHDNLWIDYLFIDIEGIDFEVIYSIDFKKHNIKNIQVEYIHYKSNELVNLILYMKDHNYIINRPIYNNDYDIIFTKQ